MKVLYRLASVAALALPMLLSGCFLLSRTRHLPIPKTPATVQTVAPEQLVEQLDQRWDAFHTLNASVEIQASVQKTAQGVTRDYTTFRGIILLRKPDMLRVYGRVPIIGTTMFDMATNGEAFTLYIPSKNKAVEGSNSVHKKAANPLENLRPGFFYDAMVVRGLDPADNYSVTADSETVEDRQKKHLLFTPEYTLNITRPKPGSRELKPVRVVTFHRDDLLPYEQDLYDNAGNLETHVTYANYQDYGFGKYPSTITIRRPLEEFQIVLTIDKITENMTLNDDQFAIKVPAGTTIQHLN
jgi:outer membrane lipoprotein-sorting protein